MKYADPALSMTRTTWSRPAMLELIGELWRKHPHLRIYEPSIFPRFRLFRWLP